MFRRRQPRTLLAHGREMVWPSAGWRRSTRYLTHRLLRLRGSPHNIAAGFATGIAISFTPFLGLQLLLAAGIAWLLRGNLVSAVVGTAAANPWTLPLIWLWIYWFGRQLLAGAVGPGGDLTLAEVAAHPWDMLTQHWDILAPLVVGGVTSAAIVWTLTYFPIRAVVASYQGRRPARGRPA